MAPPRKHETDRILDAARTLVLREGPRAASIASIARESGAPVGTLYYRFGSRDGVLAAAWLRALERFQRRALAAAEHPLPLEAAVTMACAQVSFAREHPDDARLLLTLRRDDLLDADPDDRFRADLDALNTPLEATLARFGKTLLGSDEDRTMERIIRAVVDLPNAAIRRHARGKQELPSWLEDDIAAAVRRLLEPDANAAGPPPRRQTVS